MYRLAESLAKEVMRRIKAPEIESSGPNAFLPKSLASVGVIDPIAAIGTEYFYSIESPVPILYPELPYLPTLKGYFLYRKEELLKLEEEWPIAEVFINPTCTDPEKRFDCREAAIQVASDIEKLTCKTISDIGQLIKFCPTIIDCLDLSRK